ncbi:MAG: GTP-binding protein [Dermatophilaceae bacterium]
MTPRIIPLSGFLGAGKTTTMVATAGLLTDRGARVAVITNDQGVDLVDTMTARRAVPQVDEVTGGCFCCRFEDLAALVDRLLDAGTADTVLIEAVGSCTDLQATVIRPLDEIYGEHLDVAPLTAVVDPLRYRAFARVWDRGEDSDVAYLFDHQIAEADIVALNKADLLPAPELDMVTGLVASRYPRATVLGYSAATGRGLDTLVDAWDVIPGVEWDVDIDYDRYARAEAELAWLNVVYDVSGRSVDITRWCRTAMEAVDAECRARGHLVGHVKIRATSPGGDVKLSLVGGEPVLDEGLESAVQHAQVTVNARVSCEPAAMDAIVAEAVHLADRAVGASSTADKQPSSFTPGYPVPVHRIPARV